MQILIGEDDDDARAMLRRYLEGKGHEVRAVADGQAVVDELAKDAFDIVILDDMMPRLSGLDALQKVRELGDPTPIIMATARCAPEDVVRALELGADDYVTKPYNFGVLMARIRLRVRDEAAADFAEIEPDVAAPPAPAPAPAPAARPLPPPVPASETIALSADAVLSSEDAGVEDGAAGDGDGRDGLLARLRDAAARFRRAAPAPAPELAPGSVLADRYAIEEKIGAGGFGTVFRARHLDMDRPVAIKILRAGARADSIAVFRREAQNASRVHHANAVRVYDFGALPDGTAYLVMELLVGPSLEEVLVREGRMPLARAAGIMRPVLAALACAHKQGVVHRDVKPGNIVLHKEDEHEVPKLLDFGIATHIDVADGGDDARLICGSPDYLAPERLRGAPADGRADVYACGVVLYRMLTGAFPYEGGPGGDAIERLAHAHQKGAPTAPSTRNPALSLTVDEIVLGMMNKDVAKRPNAADAASLIETLAWE